MNKIVLVLILIMILSGCTTSQNKEQECFFIARDLEDNLYFTNECYIDNDLYCMSNNRIVKVYEVEHVCEVEYGE